jgi:hypothetical protein
VRWKLGMAIESPNWIGEAWVVRQPGGKTVRCVGGR